MRASQTRNRWALFSGVLLCILVAGMAAAEGPCLTVDLARPMVFPDGTVHEAGQLTLCDWKAYTPVSQIHRSYVDGQPVQMLMGKRTISERAVSDPDEVFFRCDSSGRLELIGYARTFQGRSVTIRFDKQDSPRKVDHALARATEKDDQMIAMMARPH